MRGSDGVGRMAEEGQLGRDRPPQPREAPLDGGAAAGGRGEESVVSHHAAHATQCACQAPRGGVELSLAVPFADVQIAGPTSFAVLSVDDHGTMELHLHLVHPQPDSSGPSALPRGTQERQHRRGFQNELARTTIMPTPVLTISQLVAFDCLCGTHLEGEDTDDLAVVYGEHLAMAHPEVVLDRATLEAVVIANAYEV